MHPAGFEHGVNAWTAVDLAMLMKDAMNPLGPLAIFPRLRAGFSHAPFIVATDTDSKGSTPRRDGILLTGLSTERVTQGWLREKMAKAFFRISRSC